MILVLNKVWVFFVIAVVLAPCLVEGFNIRGLDVLPEFLNGIPMFGKFLVEKTDQFKEIPVAIFDSLFGGFESSNKFFRRFSSESFLGMTPTTDNLSNGDGDEASGSNDCCYDWGTQFIFYLFMFGFAALWVFKLLFP
jgi:hypothetical protein